MYDTYFKSVNGTSKLSNALYYGFWMNDDLSGLGLPKILQEKYNKLSETS